MGCIERISFPKCSIIVKVLIIQIYEPHPIKVKGTPPVKQNFSYMKIIKFLHTNIWTVQNSSLNFIKLQINADELFNGQVWSRYHQTLNHAAKIRNSAFLSNPIRYKILLLLQFLKHMLWIWQEHAIKLPRSSRSRIFEFPSQKFLEKFFR